MNKTLKEKINRAKQLFILSTNDMSNWNKKYSDEFYTQKFNDYYFHVDTTKGEIKISNYHDDLLISHYRLDALLFKFKMWKTVRKIINHFKQLKRDEKVKEELEFMNDGINNIEANANFIKEIRKEKLKELEK